MTKKEKRKAIFEKYNGHCAYCGCEIKIDNFVEDHIKPIYRGRDIKPDRAGEDNQENKNPACRSCNSRKNVLTIEQFRKEIELQITRLKRDNNQFNLTLRYGLIDVIDRPIVFYFEKFSGEEN